MNDVEHDSSPADPGARSAQRLTKIAVWAFAVVELVVMILAFIQREP